MIKVLNISTDTNIGGAGRLLVQYLKCFDRTKFDIVVCVPSGSLLIPLITDLGYRVIETKYGHDKSFEKNAISEYKRIIKAEKPDIVHTHSSLSGRIASCLCGVRGRIYTRHCDFEPSKKLTSFPGKQINGLMNRILSTSIIAVSHHAKESLVRTGIPEKMISVIINGVEPMREISAEERIAFRRSIGIGEDEFVCLISARLEVYKGHSYLSESAKEVLDEIGNEKKLRFIHTGDGTCREELEKQVEALGISDKVMFTGFVSDVAPYCNIMDLNLNASWGSETSSLALSEGFSLSKPAVATDVGGNTYMVTDGVNGFTVPKKDTRKMAEAILRIVRDKELYEKLSQGAKSEYEAKFTSKVMTKALEKIYEKEAR